MKDINTYLKEHHSSVLDLLNSMLNLLVIVDLKGSILTASQSLLGKLDINKNEIQKLSYLDLFNAEKKTVNLFNLLVNPKKQEFEVDIEYHESGPIPVLITTSSIIKNFYYAEDVIFILMIDLRTQRKAQAQLLESSKMAALGEMASGMAHEVNNPLTIIEGQLRRLKDSIEEDADKNDEINLVEKVQKNVDRVISIVKSFRMISRKADHDSFETIPIQEITSGITELCHQRLKEHEIDFHIHIPENTYLKCRPSQVLQVLVNLINNSIDSILNAEEKWIKINWFQDEKETQIKVTDSGHGIPLEGQIKLFEPFFTTKDVGKGTGLGLSISKGLIEAHGGKLIYCSEEKNTCFKITLPN